MRRIAYVVLTLGCLLPITAAPQSLSIFHIDVDQADATVIVSRSGNTLLIDAGKNGHGDRIRAVMASAGVTDIDHVLITHYHEDHYGGVDELVAPPAVSIGQMHNRGDKQFLPSDKTEPGTIFDDYETALGHRAHWLATLFAGAMR